VIIFGVLIFGTLRYCLILEIMRSRILMIGTVRDEANLKDIHLTLLPIIKKFMVKFRNFVLKKSIVIRYTLGANFVVNTRFFIKLNQQNFFCFIKKNLNMIGVLANFIFVYLSHLHVSIHSIKVVVVCTEYMGAYSLTGLYCLI
jgi:hypothetical protein